MAAEVLVTEVAAVVVAEAVEAAEVVAVDAAEAAVVEAAVRVEVVEAPFRRRTGGRRAAWFRTGAPAQRERS